jgi:prevent-host-death family protein
LAAIAKLGQNGQKRAKPMAESQMQTLSAKDAKYGFGRLIDLARAEPVAVAKHGRPVVIVMAIEEYERLKGIELGHLDDDPSTNGIAE